MGHGKACFTSSRPRDVFDKEMHALFMLDIYVETFYNTAELSW